MDITNRIGPSHRRKFKPGLVLIQCFVLVFISGLCKFSYAIEDYSVNVTCGNDDVCSGSSWIQPYPSCYHNRCICMNGCIHYTLNSKGFNRYFCGDCGTIGSQCSRRVECKYPANECSRFGYCTCPVGYLYGDICVHYQPVTTSKESIILIFTLVIILVLYRIISSLKWFRRLFHRCCSCTHCLNNCTEDDDSDEEVAYGYNPDSRNKTAAFTISSREFISTNEDSDLEWALQLSSIYASNLSSAEDSFIPNSYIQRQPPFRRIRNRNARDGEVPQEGATAQTSSHPSTSSHECSYNSSNCTVADDSFHLSSPSTSRTGTIQRTRSAPGGRRRRNNTNHATNGNERDYVNLRHIIMRNPSTESTSSDELATSPETSTFDTFRRVNSVPQRLLGNPNTVKYAALNENTVNASCVGLEGNEAANNDSIYSSYSSAISSFSSASGSSSTRPKRRDLGEIPLSSLDPHSQNKEKLETVRKDVSIPLADILREALSVDVSYHCENDNEVNSDTETIL